MNKEILSLKQAVCIIIMYIIGSSIVIGVSSDTGQDSWLVLIISIIMIIPVILMYSRIMKLFPEKDIFSIMTDLFGNIFGKFFIVLMLWYTIHLGSLILRNFSEYVEIVAMPETPQLPLMFCMLIISVYLSKSGAEILGKWSVISFFIVLSIIIFTIISSIPLFELSNMLPFLNHKTEEIAFSSFKLFSFPFADTVVLLALANSIDKKSSSYKIYFAGIFLSAALLMLIVLRNIIVLGDLAELDYFPSFTEAKIINIAEFVERIEGLISFNFILSGIVKLTVCMMAASKGISALFKSNNYRNFVLPSALLILTLCMVHFKNVMEMFDFINYYPIYAFPFQIIIPLTIWITAEIKNKKNQANGANKETIKENLGQTTMQT